MGQGPLQGRPRDAQPPGSLALGQPCDRGEPFCVDATSGTTEPDTLRFRSGQTSPDPLLDSRPLELRQRSQDVELQLSGRRGAINALSQADECNPHRLELLDERNE